MTPELDLLSRPRWGHRTLAVAALVAAPALAGAQPTVQRAANVYAPLPSPTILTPGTGTVDVNLPFVVRSHGVPHSSVSVGFAGALFFPAGRQVSLGNAAPGDAAAPNDWIAPLWDDLRFFAPNGGYLGHQTQGTAPQRTFTVEWRNVSRFGSSGFTVSMQVRFYEDQPGRLEIDYGPVSGSASFTATMGTEDAAGGDVALFAPSGCSTNCTTTDLGAVANTRVTVDWPLAPQLRGEITAQPAGALPGASATVSLRLSNRGTRTATGTAARLYLSTDDVLDASDVAIGSGVADLPFGDTPLDVSVTVPSSVAAGTYTLLLEVDADDAWPEVDELDNSSSGGAFTTGTNLSATGVRVLDPGVNPGDPLRLEIDLAQGALPFSGPVDVQIGASTDLAVDASDPRLGTVSVTFTGASAETVQASFTLPALTPGTYHPFVIVDPADLVPEADELDNRFLDNSTFETGPDLAASAVVVPSSGAPGTSVDVRTTIDSIAVPFTGSAPYRLWLSEDDAIDPASDLDLGTFDVTFAREPSRSDVRSVALPASLAPGRYRVIVEVDPNAAVAEQDENNNTLASPDTIATAPDFALESVSSTPNSLEIGDPLHVTAVSRNLGLPFSGNVAFTIYLSLDPDFDPGDQAVYDGLAFFPGADPGVAIDVTFPMRARPGEPQVRPGAYYVIVRHDSRGAVPEADEANNISRGGRVTLQGSDLLPVRISAPPVAFIGLPLRVNLEIENQGVANANGFTYSYFLSENDIIRVTDDRIYTSPTATIAAAASGAFEDFVTLPSRTSTACLWLGVIVNDRGDVAETNLNNNTRRILDCIQIVFPIPDLTAQVIATPTVAAAGESFAVTRLITNEGTADASRFEYTYYLSSNPTITPDDLAIGSFNGAVGVGSDDYGIDVLFVPSQVSPGDYYLGVIMDPDDLVDEVDETNNAAVGPQIPVFGAAIRFGTSSLPSATVGVPYEVAIYTSGSPLTPTWSVSQGSLPDGLALDPNSGLITGVPTTAGEQEFVLRASAGTAFADKPFSIRVLSPTVDIRVATAALPTALTGREYGSQLVAVGGQPPYTWRAISTLPVGLELSEAGVLFGVPSTPGDLPITVRVQDALGDTASKELVLKVVNPNQTLQIVQIPLPTGIIETDFCDPEPVRFEANDGTEPYLWAVIGETPPGMELSSDGQLCGTPTRAGSFWLTVRVQDSTGLFDTSLFPFEVVGRGLRITSFGLEDAKIEEAYEVELRAQGGTEPYVWAIVPGAGDLPPGLQVFPDSGRLTGTPTESGRFAFVVQVQDDVGRVTTQPLSLLVAEAPPIPQDPEGCTCRTGTGPEPRVELGLFGLGLLGLQALRRRRRRR